MRSWGHVCRSRVLKGEQRPRMFWPPVRLFQQNAHDGGASVNHGDTSSLPLVAHHPPGVWVRLHDRQSCRVCRTAGERRGEGGGRR